MAKIDSVEELDVFKKAHQVTLRIYEISRKIPEDEQFGLIVSLGKKNPRLQAN